MTNPHGTRPPTTAHPNANRQCHGTRTTQQQNLTQSTKSHGHAFPLAKVPQCPRTIPVLLETWHTEPGRLLHQAPPHHPPQVCTPNNSHISQQSRIQETLPEHRRLHKLDGTNNYARNKNFQKLPNIAETEGTKNYALNKTSKNLQKIAKLEGMKTPPPSKNLRYRQQIAELEGTKTTPPSKKSRYRQKIAKLEGTKNTPPSKNLRYRQKLLSWRVATNFQNMITAKRA